jgi:hypothetical protein
MSVVIKILIVKVFIVEGNLSTKIENYWFLNMCLGEDVSFLLLLLFLFCEKFTLKICPRTLDTHFTSRP